jgi:hypothetical protein
MTLPPHLENKFSRSASEVHHVILDTRTFLLVPLRTKACIHQTQ